MNTTRSACLAALLLTLLLGGGEGGGPHHDVTITFLDDGVATRRREPYAAWLLNHLHSGHDGPLPGQVGVGRWCICLSACVLGWMMEKHACV